MIPIIRDALDELLSQEREHAKSEPVERSRGLEAKLEVAESALRAGIERRAPQDNRSAESADEDRELTRHVGFGGGAENFCSILTE